MDQVVRREVALVIMTTEPAKDVNSFAKLACTLVVTRQGPYRRCRDPIVLLDSVVVH